MANYCIVMSPKYKAKCSLIRKNSRRSTAANGSSAIQKTFHFPFAIDVAGSREGLQIEFKFLSDYGNERIVAPSASYLSAKWQCPRVVAATTNWRRGISFALTAFRRCNSQLLDLDLTSEIQIVLSQVPKDFFLNCEQHSRLIFKIWCTRLENYM